MNLFQRLRGWIEKKLGIPAKGTRAARGRLGEKAAAKLLKKKGFKILIRNCKVGGGELDIVAKDGKMLVFVEVRARDEKALVQGYDSLTQRKRTAFARAARSYVRLLRRKPPPSYRYDVVEVRLRADKVAEIFHYENVRL